MKKVGIVLIFAVLLLAVYTFALAQYATVNPKSLTSNDLQEELR